MNEQEQTALILEMKKYLKYSQDVVGNLEWISNRPNCSRIGTKAGNKDSNGYLTLRFNYTKYKNHRVVWAFHKGYFPTMLMDHINGNREDNRIENLREATPSQNSRNTYKARRGKLLWCYYRKDCGKWISQVMLKGQQVYLGRFPTEIAAHENSMRFLDGIL